MEVLGPRDDMEPLTAALPTSNLLMFSTAAAVGGDLLGERETSGGLDLGGFSFLGSRVAEAVGG